MNLSGRIILVTGAARGLGRAFAEGCARELAEAVIVADIDEEGGRRTVAEMSAAGAPARFIRVDMSDPASVEAMAREIDAAYGRLDGLINNAALATGIGGKGFEDIDVETFDRVMAVNVRGPWLVTRAARRCCANRSWADASSISPRIPRSGARRACFIMLRARARSCR